MPGCFAEFTLSEANGLTMTCHPDPALREKDLLFFAPRDEVGQ
jgi:hypothetical protein